MNETADWLRAWAEQGSEDAFASLVARHIDLVYSVAIRKVAGDSGLAADITQTVFADLARKARSLRAEGSLAGWLHRHACYTAATALRGEMRRRVREQTAAAMHALEDIQDSDWSRLAPLLDDAVNALGESDRRAILLRFYEHHDLRTVGSLLGVNDNTAQKRVSRALEKLRSWLARRGVTSTSAVLAGVLTAQSVSAAPAGLAATVTCTALAGSAAGTGITLTLFEIMTHAKAKLAVTAALTAIVATPVMWQESAIGKVRDQNRVLATQTESLERVRAEQDQLPAQPIVQDAFAQVQAANDRAELERLRSEVQQVRAQVQQAQEARLAARRAPVSTPRDSVQLPPGTISVMDAQDVGAATSEALLQTFLWAMRTADTNRMRDLLGASAPEVKDQIEKMLSELPKAHADGKFQEAEGITFRVIRQVPLDDGDTAVVITTGKLGEEHRQAIRVRHDGVVWRIVVGKNGPQEVKLSPEQMQDP